MAEDTFKWYPFAFREWSVSALQEHLDGLEPAGFWGLTAFWDGEPAGFSTFMDIRPAHRGLEVGHTFVLPKFRGGRINAGMKLLMMEQAFDEFGAIRVQLKTDSRNIQSRRAMERMGFIQEGILRNHIIMPDGAYRDSVFFAVTRDDWSSVRERLEGLFDEAP